MNETLKIAIAAADDKKAHDMVALDISTIAAFASYFLICTGDSSRQVQAIADEIEARLKAVGVRPEHIEGYQNAQWVLLDYSDLVVHVFSKTARAYYDLERLWRDAKPIEITLENSTADGVTSVRQTTEEQVAVARTTENQE